MSGLADIENKVKRFVMTDVLNNYSDLQSQLSLSDPEVWDYLFSNPNMELLTIERQLEDSIWDELSLQKELSFSFETFMNFYDYMNS